MYVIVAGGGIVGYGLALELQRLADTEVTIVELSSSRAKALRDELGEMVVHGDGSEIAFLESVGASRADVVIAVTADDGANLVTCQVAKHWFGVQRTVARVNDPRNEALFLSLGVTSTVSASAAVMAQLEATLPEHTLVPLIALRNAGLRVIDLRVQSGAVADGVALRDLSLPPGVLVAIVVGPNGAAVPDGATRLAAGDEIIAVIPQDAEEAVRRLVSAPDDQ